jgi:hypothetical protein
MDLNSANSALNRSDRNSNSLAKDQTSNRIEFSGRNKIRSMTANSTRHKAGSDSTGTDVNFQIGNLFKDLN